MKEKETKKLGILLIVLLVIGLAWGYLYLVNRENDKVSTSDDVVTDISVVDESDMLNMSEYIDTLPQEDLTDAEKEGLIQMREEEKLAHDVYTVLYQKWGQNIFDNISDSEQTHTDSVKDLLVKYNIDDPVTDVSVGVFTSADIEELYTALVKQGKESLVEALTVGATVEDLDIYDLDILMEETDNEDILAVYQNLQKGSRNHLRSFTSLLSRNGVTYEPQYISQEDYQSIVSTASENGVSYDSKGNRR